MRIVAAIPFVLILASCAVRIVKTYDVKPDVLTSLPKKGSICFDYVYMNRDEIDPLIRRQYESVGKPWPFPYTLYGYFDYQNRILYCELFDAELCGHELFHATHGDWHY